MVVVIILLYSSTSVDFILSSYIFTGVISHRQNIWTRYLSLTMDYGILGSVDGIMGMISNILADSIMVCLQ